MPFEDYSDTKTSRRNRSFHIITDGYPFKKGSLIFLNRSGSLYCVQRVYKPRWWKRLLKRLFNIQLREQGYKVKRL